MGHLNDLTGNFTAGLLLLAGCSLVGAIRRGAAADRCAARAGRGRRCDGALGGRAADDASRDAI
jgi:hypothetical protein